jgi:hypothetical protein
MTKNGKLSDLPLLELAQGWVSAVQHFGEDSSTTRAYRASLQVAAVREQRLLKARLTNKKRVTFDPDVTRRDDDAYWAAAIMLAIRAGDKERAATARRNLLRLGRRVVITAPKRVGRSRSHLKSK